MTIIERSQQGPLRVWLTVNNDWLRLMRAKERNAVLRAAALRAVMDWRFVKLKDRFAPGIVTKPPYNYSVDTVTPLLASGKMRNLVLNGSKPYATAKTDRSGTQHVRVVLRMQYGHIVQKEIAAVMGIITPADMDFITDRFAAYVTSERAKMTTQATTQTVQNQDLTFGTRHGERIRLGRGQANRFERIRRQAAGIRLRERAAP